MLSKLLKYDLRRMYKFISIFYISTIFFAIVTRILFSLEQTIVIDIMGKISIGCMFSMMASSLINTMMRNWARFKETIYGDESYLTHTLPVTKNSIYQSKFILALINLLTTFIVIIIGLFIVYYTEDRWIIIKNVVNNISGNINISTSLFVITISLVLFLEIFNAIQAGLLGIIIGHKKNNNKILLSVFFGIIIYILSQLFILLVVFMAGLFSKDIMALFTSNSIPDMNIIKIMMISSIIIYIFINLVINIICVRNLNKGVNVE